MNNISYNKLSDISTLLASLWFILALIYGHNLVSRPDWYGMDVSSVLDLRRDRTQLADVSEANVYPKI